MNLDETTLKGMEEEARYLRSQTGAHRWIRLCGSTINLITEIRRLRKELEKLERRKA